MRNLRVVPFVAVAAMVAIGTSYAQEHGDHAAKQPQAKSDAPEIFCSHKATGQLCSGNAQMFKLSAAQKEQYDQALNNYNKAVEARRDQSNRGNHRRFAAGAGDMLREHIAAVARAATAGQLSDRDSPQNGQ